MLRPVSAFALLFVTGADLETIAVLADTTGGVAQRVARIGIAAASIDEALAADDVTETRGRGDRAALLQFKAAAIEEAGAGAAGQIDFGAENDLWGQAEVITDLATIAEAVLVLAVL